MAKGNFEELLTAQRLRGVWGRSVTPDTAVDTLNRVIKQADAGGTAPSGNTAGAASTAGAGTTAGAAGATDAGATAGTGGSIGSSSTEFPPLSDLADVPIEPPHHLLKLLEAALGSDLGRRLPMVRNIVEPLRVRIHRIDPTAGEASYHPLRHAAGGSISQLMNRLEDALAGLRRVKGK